MEKKKYRLPEISAVDISSQCLLTETTETLPFDPNDGTDESLSKQIDREIDWDNKMEVNGSNESNYWNLW